MDWFNLFVRTGLVSYVMPLGRVKRVSERKMPADWKEQVINGFEKIAPVYDLWRVKGAHNHYAMGKTEDIIASIIKKEIGPEGNSDYIFTEISVGTGVRSLNIQEKVGTKMYLRGTDLSDKMLEIAGNRGIETSNQDLAEGLPDGWKDNDAISILAGDFGYALFPGIETKFSTIKRAELLTDYYSGLKDGGHLFLELFYHSRKFGSACEYQRIPTLFGINMVYRGAQMLLVGDALNFYIKDFGVKEVKRLSDRAKISQTNVDLYFVDRTQGAPEIGPVNLASLNKRNINDICPRNGGSGYFMLVDMKKN